MRICMVNPFFHPYIGGTEKRMLAIGRRLSERHEVHVVTSQLPETEPSETVDGIEVHRLPSRYFHAYNPPVVFTRGVKDKIRGLGPDLIHLHYRWSLEYTRSVASFSGDIPILFTWHNYFGEGVGWQRPLSLMNDELFKVYFTKKCDRMICVSESLKNQLLDHGIPSEVLRVVYNGIDVGKPSHKEEDFILYIGRLVQPKGLDVLASAMKGVKGKLLVCGRGPLSSELEGIPNVELLGHVPEEKKIRLLERCKFLVLPSRMEAFGIVLLEAMAVGKPVVAARVGGVPEVVGDAGILVPPGDSKKLEGAINTLLSDDKLRRELGRKAWKRANLFSWDKMTSQVEDVYQEVLA